MHQVTTSENHHPCVRISSELMNGYRPEYATIWSLLGTSGWKKNVIGYLPTVRCCWLNFARRRQFSIAPVQSTWSSAWPYSFAKPSYGFPNTSNNIATRQKTLPTVGSWLRKKNLNKIRYFERAKSPPKQHLNNTYCCRPRWTDIPVLGGWISSVFSISCCSSPSLHPLDIWQLSPFCPSPNNWAVVFA